MELSQFRHSQGGSRMGYSNAGLLRKQYDFLKQQFLQDGELPFTEVLSPESLKLALVRSRMDGKIASTRP